MQYYFSKTMETTSFREAIEKVKTTISKEGFGVVTEIDFRKTMKEKLNRDFREYTILGVCNPGFAYRAVSEERHIGVLLPCNFVLQQHENGTIEVAVVNPAASMSSVGNDLLEPLAMEVQTHLKNIIQHV